MNIEAPSVKRSILPDFLLFSSTIVWGFSFTVLKDILGNQISPGLFVFLRFSIGSLAMLPFCIRGIRGLGRDGFAGGAFLGLLLFVGFFTQTIGIGFTTASKSAFITALASIFVPVILFLHKRKLPEPLTIAAIIVAAAGLYMLTGFSGGGFNKGDLLTLVCAISFASQIYVMGIEAGKHDTLGLTWMQMACVAVLAGLALPAQETFMQLSVKAIGAVLFMAILATAVALSIQTWAQKRTTAVRAGLIYAAEPVFAYMFAASILGERFSAIQKIGGAIIILAVISIDAIPLLASRIKAKSK